LKDIELTCLSLCGNKNSLSSFKVSIIQPKSQSVMIPMEFITTSLKDFSNFNPAGSRHCKKESLKV